LSYTEIPEVYSVDEKEKIKIYWKEQNKFIDFNAYDLNSNGRVDYVEWVVPHLSEQTFEIILISKAEHLDTNRNFISDIYKEVYSLDNIWSNTINENEFVRVRFEKKLSNKNDITIYPRVVSGSPKIEVYEKDKNEIIAEFSNIQSEKYNKIYLTNLVNEQDVFDLFVLNGKIEFDHIIDPTANDLISYWKLNTNVDGITPDEMGVNDGIVNSVGFTSRYRDGVVLFRQSNSHIDLNKMDLTDQFTISLWFNALSFLPGGKDYADNRLISKAKDLDDNGNTTDENDHYWMMSTINSSEYIVLRARLKNESGYTKTIIGNSNKATIETRRWYQVALVYDGSQMKLYQDGVLVNSSSFTGKVAKDPTADVYIGLNPPNKTGGNAYGVWHGYIDDVAIFNRALTEEEIREINNSGYVVLDQIPVSQCKELGEANKYYILQKDITATGTCFNITADNITLDGNGKTVNNSLGMFGIGLQTLTNLKNITIKNVTFTGFDKGIYFDYVNDSVIENVNLTNNEAGIHFNNNNRINVTDSYFDGRSGSILTFDGGGNNNILRNDFVDIYSRGILIAGSDNNLFENNSLFGRGSANGIRLEYNAKNNVFRNNSFEGCNIYISGSSHNQFINGEINGSNKAIYFYEYGGLNNTFNNISIRNSADYDVYFAASSNTFNDTKFVNMSIGSYALADEDCDIEGMNGCFYRGAGNLIIENTQYGKIEFLSNVSGSGTNLSNDIRISDNSAFVRSDLNPGLNVPANITLYNIGDRGFQNPEILKNGFPCGDSCYNFTPLDAETVIFNVTSWTEYSIGETTKITSCPFKILQPGKYFLSQDIYSGMPFNINCIEIYADNVTIDGMGHSITGNEYSLSGIYIPYSKNTTIMNVNIRNFRTGIESYSATNMNLNNNTLLDNSLNGIQLDDSSNNSINNNILKRSGTGIYLHSNSKNNIFRNNQFIENMQSVYDTTGNLNVNYLVYNNSFGEIKWTDDSPDGFLRDLSFTGDIGLGINLTIDNNFVELNEEAFTGKINSSANITLYGLPGGFENPAIFKDDYFCSPKICQNLTSLEGSMAVFNVSYWSNYSIKNVVPVKPVIINITDLNEQEITPGNANPITFNVTIGDINGYQIIKNINATFSRNLIERYNSSCSFLAENNATSANFSCTIDIWYFDEPGEWNVTATAIDYFDVISNDYSENFTLTEQGSYVISPGALIWGSALMPGETNKLAGVSLVINNTGNKNVLLSNIYIKAIDLIGEQNSIYSIPADKFSIYTENVCDLGEQMSNTAPVPITTAYLPRGNNSINKKDETSGQEELFVCLEEVPTGIPSQTYSAKGINSWELTCIFE